MGQRREIHFFNRGARDRHTTSHLAFQATTHSKKFLLENMRGGQRESRVNKARNLHIIAGL
jgi:hypothetical protein